MKCIQFCFCSVLLMIITGLSGCRTIEKLSNVDEVPPLSHIQNPVSHPNYRPVTMPMPRHDNGPETKWNNSLWKTGAKTFFQDNRAREVGDILTVVINVDEKASISNSTKTSRESEMSTQIPNLMGYEKRIASVLPKGANPASLIDVKSNPKMEGEGTIKRKHKVQFNMAATITQILPNGNFVISGRQEMRVNYDVREVVVAGVIRPEDITSSNAISSDKIAEARISYGGRGKLDEVQQEPWGQQVLNAILPF